MKQRGGRAFSLLEVMVSMAIFGVGLAAVLSSFTTIRHVYSMQRDIAIAQGIAQRFSEQMLTLPKDSDYIKNFQGHQNTFHFDLIGRGVPNQNARYRLAYTIAENTPYPGVLKADITVRWTDEVREHEFPIHIYVR